MAGNPSLRKNLQKLKGLHQKKYILIYTEVKFVKMVFVLYFNDYCTLKLSCEQN